MSLVRLIAPTSGAWINGARVMNPATVNGRAYSASSGSFVDAELCDASVLSANGWTMVGFVGPSSARPSPARVTGADTDGARQYVDTTLGSVIVWDGERWRHAVTGAAV